ncbi:2-dehydropantoate 2-reductase [Nitzschia inconspicua]|uniref:2-dehydropantoate 2-reductase n=1 Tax=Nitzschia inconspicua TaxID=303405 RepID=A0A9K3LJS4_9STRA|nr:2-dehydropantoate 2-reductase [Nitzschia inconspicua]
MNQSKNIGRIGMSRRQQQLPPPTSTTTAELPLHVQQQQQQSGSHQRSSKRKMSESSFLPSNAITAGGAISNPTATQLPLPPRSGQQLNIASSLLENIEEFMNYGAPKKKRPQRKFHVDIPSRLLVILAIVFLIGPLIIFLHKEAHIHDVHREAHFKPEKFVNVDTESVLSQFRDNNITRDEASRDHNATRSNDHEKTKMQGNFDSTPTEEKVGGGRENRTVTEATTQSQPTQSVNQTLSPMGSNHSHTMGSNSTDLKSSDRKSESVCVPVEYLLEDPKNNNLGPIQNLLVTTKSYQAVKSVLSRMNTHHADSTINSRIILLCNGALSVKEELEALLLQNHRPIQMVLATTTHGAYREQHEPSAQKLIHAGYGQTFIEESAKDIENLWDEAGLNCISLSSQAMQSLLWQKLAANCVINPLTALYQCTNGELLLEPSFPLFQAEILEEVSKVLGVLASNGDDTDNNCCEVNVNSLGNFVNQVIRDTSTNKSSMYQDIVHGHRTEIDHLNGYVVRKGRDLGIQCPANEDIVERIKEKEKS